MWFAIAPVMKNVHKVKCAEPDSDICVKCAAKYPDDDMFYNKEGEIPPGEIDPAKGASDKECRMCYPYDSRVKGAKGCGGLDFIHPNGFYIKQSTWVAVSGTIILRILIGPISDGIGIRMAYTVLLCLSAIPGFLLAAANNYTMLGESSPHGCMAARQGRANVRDAGWTKILTDIDLARAVICRFMIGFAGSSFVLTQLWTTTMFDLSVVGIANATSAGWGNLGGG